MSTDMPKNRDVLGPLAGDTWHRDDGLGPYRRAFVGSTAVLFIAGTIATIASVIGVGLSENQADVVADSIVVNEADPAASGPEATAISTQIQRSPHDFTPLEAAPLPELQEITVKRDELGLIPDPEPQSDAEPDRTVGLAGDNDGVKLPALRLPLDDAAVRELLLSGKARAVAREANGTAWVIMPGSNGLRDATISRLSENEQTLGQREIPLHPATPVWRSIESAVRNDVVLSGRLSVGIAFTRELDEQLIAQQRTIADQFDDEIAQLSDVGGLAVISGCWSEGSFHLLYLYIGETIHNISDYQCSILGQKNE